MRGAGCPWPGWQQGFLPRLAWAYPTAVPPKSARKALGSLRLRLDPTPHRGLLAAAQPAPTVAGARALVRHEDFRKRNLLEGYHGEGGRQVSGWRNQGQQLWGDRYLGGRPTPARAHLQHSPAFARGRKRPVGQQPSGGAWRASPGLRLSTVSPGCGAKRP